MKFGDIDREIRLCYGAHQAFMRLGFFAEHLFCGIQAGVLLVVARVPRKPEFVLTVCPTAMSLDDFTAKWTRLVEAMQTHRTIDDNTRERIFEEFRGVCPAVPFIHALMNKGLLPTGGTASA